MKRNKGNKKKQYKEKKRKEGSLDALSEGLEENDNVKENYS
jgi:hypothetical protein